MPYAVTAPLDSTAAATVERMWHELADRIGDDGAIRLGYAPHISLAILSDMAPAAKIEEAVFGGLNNWEPFDVVLASIGVFPGAPPVVWIGPVVTERLLTWHASLYAALASLPVHPHYHPDAWVPHVTLSQERLSSAAQTIEIVTSMWKGPINVRLERIELVRFQPVQILRSEAFRYS
jgi:2'-5' RNA ligase